MRGIGGSYGEMLETNTWATRYREMTKTLGRTTSATACRHRDGGRMDESTKDEGTTYGHGVTGDLRPSTNATQAKPTRG